MTLTGPELQKALGAESLELPEVRAAFIEEGVNNVAIFSGPGQEGIASTGQPISVAFAEMKEKIAGITAPAAETPQLEASATHLNTQLPGRAI